jgi:nicotinamidase-related amidase
MREGERTALLVVDVQRDVVVEAHARDEVLANINTLVDRAREHDVPVIWVQHSDADLPKDSPGWQLDEALTPHPDEPRIHKNFRDAFEHTALGAVLADAGVGRLLICGAQTDACVRWTLHGAMHRGYDTVLVGDAHTTDDLSHHDGFPSAAALIRHTNAFWRSQTAPGRHTDVMSTSGVSDFLAGTHADAHR